MFLELMVKLQLINSESKEHARIDDQTFGLLIVRVHAIFEVLDLLGIARHSGLIDFLFGQHAFEGIRDFAKPYNLGRFDDCS